MSSPIRPIRPGPVSSLSTFAEGGLRAVYTATNKNAFDTAFSEFFARNVEVTLNGKKVDSAHFKQELWNEKHNERRGTVTYLGIVEYDKDKKPANVRVIVISTCVRMSYSR